MDFRVLKILLAAEIVLLFIQFWLGMTINLFVSLPMNTPFNFSAYSGGYEFLAHVITGLSVLLIAGVILSYGSRLKNNFVSGLAIAALVFAFIAPATGYAFALGGQDNSLSMAMAMSFLIVYTIYLSEFFMIQRIQTAFQTKVEAP